MIRFDYIKYETPNYESIKQEVKNLICELKEADNFDNYIRLVSKIISIQNKIEQLCDYADIRNMRNSKDEYYSKEIEYWNEYKPKFDVLFLPFYEICINSKFRKESEKYLPPTFFLTIEYQLKTSSEKITQLLQEENRLKTEYRKLIDEKTIYNGIEVNLPAIELDFNNVNRDKRKEAHDIYNDFFYERQSRLDTIYYKMVEVRNKIAIELGFENYSLYSIYKLRRFGYDYKDISSFRNNIIKYVIPVCKKVREYKKSNLGLDDLKYYDTILFKDMPILKYEGNELLEKFKECTSEVSIELGRFYKEMLDHGYIDLVHRDNKINFYITNYLTEMGYPVITGNFLNSYFDVKTTSHEFGHSYQKYNSSLKDKEHIISSLLKYPTFEIAEMFSFAMELILMEHVSSIFSKEDHDKYCFLIIVNLMDRLPYSCLIDEFQERVYSTPNLAKEDIRKMWLELSKKYGLEISNSGHKNLDSGGYFYRQNHLFLDPFYFIDYALACSGAISICNECKDNLNSFEKLGAVASYYPFNELIKTYGMPNPFEEETVKNISNYLDEELNKIKVKTQ